MTPAEKLRLERPDGSAPRVRGIHYSDTQLTENPFLAVVCPTPRSSPACAGNTLSYICFNIKDIQ